jgi:hypothetical protein
MSTKIVTQPNSATVVPMRPESGGKSGVLKVPPSN